jgi:hypothetical protein
MVKDLAIFYADKKNILDIWNSLNVCERDFITYFVQYGGKEYLPTTVEYAKKHNISVEYKTGSGYNRSILDEYDYSYLKFLHLLTRHIPETKAVLLFPNGREMPSFIFEVLQPIVEPMKYKYEKYVSTKADYVICRESRIGDFASIVRFAGSEQLKVKEGTYDITKAKLVKLSETIGFEEVCDREGTFCALKEAKRNRDFKVAPLLFALAANSQLLDIDTTGNVSPGKQSTDQLIMPPHELAKKLFNDYIHENKIYELHYATNVTSYDREKWIKWDECRKTITLLLKTCPTETFIKFEDFNKYAKIFCIDFFRRLLYYYIGGYSFSYSHVGSYDSMWDEREAQIIMVILSFLSALGMIDIAYTQNVRRTKYSYEYFYVGISGFRITKLGAWILGMTDKYEASTVATVRNDEGELLVLPDYSIIISGLKCRIAHEIYLSRFLTKISSDDNASIYKLDSKSIIRAYDNGITPMRLKKYLEKTTSKAFPDNIERSLTDWQAKVGRVKIRELTVIETDDKLLLEEIKHIKAMGGIINGDLPYAVILNKDSKKRAKTLIEKNGWLVDT